MGIQALYLYNKHKHGSLLETEVGGESGGSSYCDNQNTGTTTGGESGFDSDNNLSLPTTSSLGVSINEAPEDQLGGSNSGDNDCLSPTVIMDGFVILGSVDSDSEGPNNNDGNNVHEDNNYGSIFGLGSNCYNSSGFPFTPDPDVPSEGGGGLNFGQGSGIGVSDSNQSDSQDSSLTSHESGAIDSRSASSGDASSGSNTFNPFQHVKPVRLRDFKQRFETSRLA